jgi:phenolic acid decarboxylase
VRDRNQHHVEEVLTEVTAGSVGRDAELGFMKLKRLVWTGSYISMEIEVDMRVDLTKHTKRIEEQLLRIDAVHGNTELSLATERQNVGSLLQRMKSFQQGLCLVQKREALLRQRRASSFLFEQSHPKQILELCDGIADRGLAHMERFCGAAKAPLPDDGIENRPVKHRRLRLHPWILSCLTITHIGYSAQTIRPADHLNTCCRQRVPSYPSAVAKDRTFHCAGETNMAAVNLFQSTKPSELSAFLGKHFIYTYENGWQYEMYLKNDRTIDYRIHTGMVGGRWVRNQVAHIVRLADDVVKISWDEPTGTTVSVAFMLNERKIHGVIFFPQWIELDPKKTVCFQNDHLEQMKKYRDAGPTYPKLVIDEFAEITFVEDCGLNNEEVIECAPDKLPAGYASRQN